MENIDASGHWSWGLGSFFISCPYLRAMSYHVKQTFINLLHPCIFLYETWLKVQITLTDWTTSTQQLRTSNLTLKTTLHNDKIAFSAIFDIWIRWSNIIFIIFRRNIISNYYQFLLEFVFILLLLFDLLLQIYSIPQFTAVSKQWTVALFNSNYLN